jgi:hypothetical protein
VLRTYLVYNTVVRLCQFLCCGAKVNFVQIPYSHDLFSKISRTFFIKKMIPYKTYVWEDQLFLALYGSTTIQSQLFLKNYWELCLISETTLIGFLFFREIQDRGFLFLQNTLLLYSLSPYSWTESQRESQIHLLCMGWRKFFSSCAVVSVFFSGGK